MALALTSLPNELLLHIATSVPSQSDLSSLSRTSLTLHHLLTPTLYRTNIRHFASTALFFGARHNRPCTIRRMLDSGADINTTCEEGWTALDIAAAEGHEDVVRLLLEQGASAGFRAGRPWTPLCAAAAGGFGGVVKMLLLAFDSEVQSQSLFEGEDEKDTPTPTPSPERKNGVGPCPRSPRNGQETLVKLLFVTEGPDLDRRGVQFSIPLFMAIANAHDAVAGVLLEDGRVDLGFCDVSGRTALVWAESHGRKGVARVLREMGAGAGDVKGGDCI